ncbi:DUF6318 family protein [Brachybacterium tyrofermentans]|uniref:DUF6318 family protein n=1 Tax=Brachybacterium tyrofermentans TaxID=47848 RepID=A0ABW0FC14_9MICO
MSRRLLAIAAAAALTFTFAACDVGGDGPVTEPPQQVGTSDGGGAAPSDGGGAAPSDGGDDDQTVAASDIPAPDPADYAGMDEHTADGATQAFRYYIAVSMWAHQTGETELLGSLQSDDCESCDEFNKDVPMLVEHDEYWSPFTITDNGSKIHESVNFDHEIGYYFTTSPHSRPVETFDDRFDVDEIQYIAVGGMTWESDRWVTEGVDAKWGEDAFS